MAATPAQPPLLAVQERISSLPCPARGRLLLAAACCSFFVSPPLLSVVQQWPWHGHAACWPGPGPQMARPAALYGVHAYRYFDLRNVSYCVLRTPYKYLPLLSFQSNPCRLWCQGSSRCREQGRQAASFDMLHPAPLVGTENLCTVRTLPPTPPCSCSMLQQCRCRRPSTSYQSIFSSSAELSHGIADAEAVDMARGCYLDADAMQVL